MRMKILKRCGPSPARALYREGFVYEVSDSEAAWLIAEVAGYEEGTEPPLCEEDVAEMSRATVAKDTDEQRRLRLLESRRQREQAKLDEHNRVLMRNAAVATAVRIARQAKE